MKSLRRTILALLAQPLVYASSQFTISDDLERTCYHLKACMDAFSTHNEIFNFVRKHPELASEAGIAYRQATESNRLRLGDEFYETMDQTIEYWEQIVPWIISLNPDVNPPVPEDPTNLIENIQSKSDLLQNIDEFESRVVKPLIDFWKDCPAKSTVVDTKSLALGLEVLRMEVSRLPDDSGSTDLPERANQP